VATKHGTKTAGGRRSKRKKGDVSAGIIGQGKANQGKQRSKKVSLQRKKNKVANGREGEPIWKRSSTSGHTEEKREEPKKKKLKTENTGQRTGPQKRGI